MIRIKAYSVHLFTALGAIAAMLALLAADEAQWSIMVLWLVAAFVIDGIDGPLARHYDVQKNASQIDGVLLDLVIDYLTYVFVPAFALFRSGLLNGWSGWLSILMITYSSAIYFSDKRMKTEDNSFRGFPACWNMLVLVLLIIAPHWSIILTLVLCLSIAMFLPVKFIHPVRTTRWRKISLPIALLWTVLVGIAAFGEFHLTAPLELLLIASSTYLLTAGAAQQLKR